VGLDVSSDRGLRTSIVTLTCPNVANSWRGEISDDHMRSIVALSVRPRRTEDAAQHSGETNWLELVGFLKPTVDALDLRLQHAE
jgi:hypothetical protein